MVSPSFFISKLVTDISLDISAYLVITTRLLVVPLAVSILITYTPAS